MLIPKHQRHIFSEAWYLLCLALLLAACASSPSTTASPPTATPARTTLVSSPPPVPETCQPTPLASAADQIPEAKAQGTNAEVWALFFADPRSIHTGQEVKIVWRMTGSGDFHIVARHAGNQQIQPVWGPEPHGGSSWNRPGSEWGTGFKFPSPGCWDLHTTRDASSGDLWLMIK